MIELYKDKFYMKKVFCVWYFAFGKTGTDWSTDS